jgi:hypothetical protein
MQIEQAIFTSARTARAVGYQVVAASGGISSADLEEIAVWSPSHDSLIERGPSASSTNFWRLTSGNYCVSRTTTSGGEYSGRVGPRVYTQCLIPTIDMLSKFANNPFALLRAAMVQGALEVYDDPPRQLEPIKLAGRAAAVDQTALAEVLGDVGPRALAALVDTVLKQSRVALVSNRSRPALIAALLNCLPVECRLEFSFSTGLELSPRRPFRIVCQPDDPTVVRRIQRLGGWQVYRLEEPVTALTTSWANYLSTVLANDQTAALATQLTKRRPQLTLANLESLARSLAAAHDAGELQPVETSNESGVAETTPAAVIAGAIENILAGRGAHSSVAHSDAAHADTTTQEACFPRLVRVVGAVDPSGGPNEESATDSSVLHSSASEDAAAALLPFSGQRGRSQNDLPPSKTEPVEPAKVAPGTDTRRGLPTGNPSPATHRPDPVHQRPKQTQRALARTTEKRTEHYTRAELDALEHLDDVVFGALVGQTDALDNLRRLWPETLNRLGERLLAESRDHYLRRALAVWRQSTGEGEIRDPLQALTAIEVICLLYGE